MDYFGIFILGIFVGMINTIAAGGSLISIPVLIFMGVPAITANGTVRIGVIFQNINASIAYFRKKSLPFRSSLLITLPASLGALLGSLYATEMSDALFEKILSIAMLVSVLIMLRSKSLHKRKFNTDNQSLKLALLLIAFFIVGIYGGMIQSGVGFLIIFSLYFLTENNLHQINAMKCFVVLVYNLIAIVSFIYAGKINFGYGFALAGGSSIGAWLAVSYSMKKGEKFILWVIFTAVIGFAIKLLFF